MKKLLKAAALALVLIILVGCTDAEERMSGLVSDFDSTFETTAVPQTVLEAMSDLIKNYSGGVRIPTGSITNLNGGSDPTNGSTPSGGGNSPASPTSAPNSPTSPVSPTSGGQTPGSSPVSPTAAPSAVSGFSDDSPPHDICHSLDELKENVLYYMLNIVPEFTVEINSPTDYSKELLEFATPYFPHTYPLEGMYFKYCSLSHGISSKGKFYTFRNDYFKPVDEVREEIVQCREELKKINDDLGLGSKTDYEVISTVNDYLCDSVTYPKTQPYSEESYTVYGAVIERNAVCEGYAKTAKALFDMNGIECYYVAGTTPEGRHGWNLVKLDRQWYHLDVTWNDSGNIRDAYFLVTDSYMSYSRSWDTSMYPASANSNYK